MVDKSTLLYIFSYYYNCSALSLFELGSLHHHHYLLNVRLPATFDSANQGAEIGVEYNNLGKLVDLHLVAIYQNGGFTQVWLGLKSFFFPCLLAEAVWYWRRIKQVITHKT